MKHASFFVRASDGQRSWRRVAVVLALMLRCGLYLPGTVAAATGVELLRDPLLVNAEGRELGAAWRSWEPDWPGARLRCEPTTAGMACTDTNTGFAVGGIAQLVNGIKPGQAYAVSARGEIRDVPQPFPSALLRVEWLKAGQPLHPAGVLARGPVFSGADFVFEDVFVAPPEADAARVVLETRWLRGGTLIWRQASFRESTAPPARPVKVGTVYLRPRDSTPQRNLELWCEQIDAAGKLGLDIVCLSEAILLVGTRSTHAAVAEPVPGPATARLGEAARRNRLWVVAGLIEVERDTLFNTAVLFDRDGRLAGRYRKVHLPREEWRQGITPGSEHPVFETDFGRIAIQICYDYLFPASAELFAQRGAEILFAPTWGTTFADEDGRVEGQTIFRVRARDHGLYVVASVYDGESLVIDPLGRVLAANRGRTGVFWAEIDLARREPLWWVGHWRSIAPRDRRPETYGGLTRSSASAD